MAYPTAEATFADADRKIDLARGILARSAPVTEGDLGWAYLVKTRKLPPAAVRAALPELRLVEPLIEGRDAADYGLMSLLRDAHGEISGFQLTFIDVLGAASARAPKRQSYSLRPNGCRDGLSHAGGGERRPRLPLRGPPREVDRPRQPRPRAALVVRPAAGRELCRQAILRYLPEDAPAAYEARLAPEREKVRLEVLRLLAEGREP